jgi:hypothetical protein
MPPSERETRELFIIRKYILLSIAWIFNHDPIPTLIKILKLARRRAEMERSFKRISCATRTIFNSLNFKSAA